jgi:hypothetical protein
LTIRHNAEIEGVPFGDLCDETEDETVELRRVNESEDSKAATCEEKDEKWRSAVEAYPDEDSSKRPAKRARFTGAEAVIVAKQRDSGRRFP